MEKIKTNCYWLFTNFIAFLLRRLLAIRYRVKLVGTEKIPYGLKGVLVIPNHPALIDPVILTSHLWNKMYLRPMVWEPGISSPVISWIKPLVNPVLIKNSIRNTAETKKQAQEALDEVVTGLKAGENHIMYPSGRLYRCGYESLGKVRGLTHILKSVPDVKLLLVRTTGLLGSSFSVHFTGDAPNLTNCMLRAIWIAISNFIFFVPKREVTIELEWIDTKNLPEFEINNINKFFEDMYNKNGEQKPTLVPSHFLFQENKNHIFPPIIATGKH